MEQELFFERRLSVAQKNEKVIKYNRSFNLNIGVVIFLVIIIYVIFHIFSYLTSSSIAEYQVSQGTIATNNIYRGLIIRDETIAYAEQSGYINYYVSDGSKVAINDIIYSIDTNGDVSSKITSAVEDGSMLDSASIGDFIGDINGFTQSYNVSDFTNVNYFKEQLASNLTQTLSQNALSSLKDAVGVAEQNSTFYKFSSPNPGIISYRIDGFEGMSVSDFKKEDLVATGYSSVDLDKNTEVNQLDPVYKRVNSEVWNIIIEISDSLAEELNEGTYVKIRFCEDDYSCYASYKIIKKENLYFLNLELKNSMIRYLNERYVDIELVLNSKTGLKIPNSAITSKEFFKIPISCFTKGAESDDPCLLIKADENDGGVKLVTPTIYCETEDYYYVDEQDVSAGDVIVLNDTSSTYVIGTDKESLVGVYNINKGYAVFKQINIISQNDDYAIVDTKTAYGISLYDHIALNGDSVHENDIINK